MKEINRTGIRKTDPRMAQMMKSLDKLKPPSLPSVEELKLDLQAFKYVVSENVVLITKALQNQMIIPAFDAFCDNITKIYHNVSRAMAAFYVQYTWAECWLLTLKVQEQ